jgi:hypothetical protein
MVKHLKEGNTDITTESHSAYLQTAFNDRNKKELELIRENQLVTGKWQQRLEYDTMMSG